MNSRTLATIACKALALYGILISLNYLVYFVSSLMSLGSPSGYDNKSELVFSAIAETVPYLLQLAFVVLLWNNAEPIARKMVPDSPDQGPSQFTLDQIYIVSFTIIGIFILIETLPVFFYQLANLWATRKLDFRREQLAERYIGLIVPGIKIILALMLLFGNKSIIKTITRFREFINERIDARRVANGA